MRRALYFVALASLLVLVAVPAIGDHVTEPTAPVTGLQLDVYQYTNPSTTMMLCNGTDQITFDLVRIEPRVWVAAKPSEHYTVNVQVVFAETLSGRAAITFKQWGITWKHQNVSPHATGGLAGRPPVEVAETNQYLWGRLGFWTVSATVIGEESGGVFSKTCVFERVAG